MASDFPIEKLKEVVLRSRYRSRKKVAEECWSRCRSSRAYDVELGPIARRHDESFIDSRNLFEAFKLCRQDSVGDSELFAYLDTGGVMAEAEANKIHRSEAVSDRKRIPQKVLSRRLNATMERVAIHLPATVRRILAKRMPP